MPKIETRLPDAVRVRIQALIDAKGIGQAAKLLQATPTTVKCAVLGGAIQLGTIALLEKQLAERDRQGKNP
jgi:hypothetical protein